MSITYNTPLTDLPPPPHLDDPPAPLPRPVNPDGLADFGDTLDGEGLGI